MSETRKELVGTESPRPMTTNPIWWTDTHTSSWEHVKGAMERDWEQTKADFSMNGGHELNQNLADTILQSMGSEPIPPHDAMTRPTDVPAGAHPSSSPDNMITQKIEISDVRAILADRQAQATQAFVNAQDRVPSAQASTTMGHLPDVETSGHDHLFSKWHNAELGARFGYSARTQYPADHVWDEQVDAKLREEWDALGTGWAWHACRPAIHHGWDYVGKEF